MKGFVCIYIVLAAVLMTVLTDGGMRVSQDSKLYIVTADLLESGDIERAKSVMTKRHVAPLYPYVLSFFKDEGNVDYASYIPLKKVIVDRLPFVRLVSIMGFMLGVTGIFLLGWQVGSALTAHLSALFFLGFWPLVSLFTYGWTEVLYIPLTIFALLALVLYEQRGSCLWWLVSALLVGLSLITRHVGLSLVVAGLLIVAHKSKGEPVKIIPWAALALSFMFLDHHLLDPRSTTYGGWVQFSHFLKVGFLKLGLLVFVAIALGLVLKVPLWWGIPLYVGLYLAFVFAQSWYRWVAPSDTLRYLAPVFPFVFLYVAKVIHGAHCRIREGDIA